MAKNLEFQGKNVQIVGYLWPSGHSYWTLADDLGLYVFYSKAADQIVRLYKLFCKLDCTQLEINPFGETPDGRGLFKWTDQSLLPPA